MGVTIVAAPIALIGGAWSCSKLKKNRKEKAIKAATAEYMAGAGSPVSAWRVLSKKEARALASTAPPLPRP